MDDTKAVGNEGVTELGVLTGQFFALLVDLGGLAGVVADVLEQGDLALTEGCNGRSGGLADDVGGQGDLHAGELGEALGDGGQRECGVDLALGAAEVGQDDDLGTGIGQRLEGRQRRADAAIVSDDAVLERNIEIGTDQDALAAQVAQGGNGPHGGILSVERKRRWCARCPCTCVHGHLTVSSWLYRQCSQASLEPTRAVRRTRAFE